MIPGAVHWPAWAAGWLSSALNATVGHVLHTKAVGMGINRFLWWGFAAAIPKVGKEEGRERPKRLNFRQLPSGH
jgi:hypothetical protein